MENNQNTSTENAEIQVRYNGITHKKTNEAQEYLIQTMGFILEKGDYSFKDFNQKALEFSSSQELLN